MIVEVGLVKASSTKSSPPHCWTDFPPRASTDPRKISIKRLKMNYQCDLCLSIECITQWYVKIYISCPKSALSLQIYSVNLISQRQVVSCKNKNKIMVVVSDLGPPEEGVRHTQPAVATYVNRFRNLTSEEAGWQDIFWSGSRWAWARSTSLRQGCPGLASRER